MKLGKIRRIEKGLIPNINTCRNVHSVGCDGIGRSLFLKRTCLRSSGTRCNKVMRAPEGLGLEKSLLESRRLVSLLKLFNHKNFKSSF